MDGWPGGLARRGSGEVAIEVLDEAPPRLGRPLGLVGGRAYAVTWLYVRVHRLVEAAGPPAVRARAIVVEATATEERVDGAIAGPTVLAAPAVEVRTEWRPYVVRDDGVVFGDRADQPLGALGVEVGVSEPPREERLWRRVGVEAYRGGARPDPADVFGRLVAAYDRFVDFGGSLAGQEAMCHLCGCLSLATWLSDAFTLVPYLWITGERGSGKTQLGTVWAETSYLGEVVLPSGSYAALRDLAELGAALYFDDAEAFGGGRRGAVAKRELLLAGNRRGARVALKGLVGERWATRWVSAYTPRAFSAIALPEATLGSRAIVVPLRRTGDPVRGQRDPGDPASWPCDRRALQDDLWALGLWWLPRAGGAWRALEDEGELVGREYEKWRPVLAVARLLEGHGVAGVEGWLREVMRAYQAERVELVADDETLEVVRGLVSAVEWAKERLATWGADDGELARWWRRTLPTPTAVVVDAVRRSTPEGMLASRSDRAAATRVGQIMARLRFKNERASGSERTRGWALTVERVVETARAYGVPTRLGEGYLCGKVSQVSGVSRIEMKSAPSGEAVPGVRGVPD